MPELSHQAKKLLLTEMYAIHATLMSMEGLEELIRETQGTTSIKEQEIREIAKLTYRFRGATCALAINQENRKNKLIVNKKTGS